VIGGGALLYMNHLAPQRTVSTFIDALNNNDFQTAYDQLSSNFQNQIGGVQQFENMYPNLGSATYTLNITQEDSSTAIVVWTQTDSACLGAQDTLHLVYENSAWKIDSISFDVPCSQ
jgi:hypothetical protein